MERDILECGRVAFRYVNQVQNEGGRHGRKLGQRHLVRLLSLIRHRDHYADFTMAGGGTDTANRQSVFRAGACRLYGNLYPLIENGKLESLMQKRRHQTVPPFLLSTTG